MQPAVELVAAEMETVLYAQMLALFAPQVRLRCRAVWGQLGFTPQLLPMSHIICVAQCLLGFTSKEVQLPHVQGSTLRPWCRLSLCRFLQAVRGAAHVQPLLATLASRQPALRRAAADTLRHLAERCATLLQEPLQ